jgi:hypothetical protein
MGHPTENYKSALLQGWGSSSRMGLLSKDKKKFLFGVQDRTKPSSERCP